MILLFVLFFSYYFDFSQPYNNTMETDESKEVVKKIIDLAKNG